MSGKIVLCSVLESGTHCRIEALSTRAPVGEWSNVDKRFHDRRKRGDVFFPVAALECDPADFASATSWSLPADKPISLAAFIFQRVGIPDSVRRACTRQWDYAPTDLFFRWVEACDSQRQEYP